MPKAIFEKEFIESLWSSRKYRALFEEIEAYAMFVGYPGSGHSLVGALLDAHPSVVIAHELDAIERVRRGYSQDQIFYLLLKRSREFTRAGRNWTGHNYSVPNQWHATWKDRLSVLGDKKGGRTSRYLGRDVHLLDALFERIRLPIKLIHVIRNPFDNISTMTRRTGRLLERSIELYFARCDAVVKAMARTPRECWITVEHENLVDRPGDTLRELCEFLGQPADDSYLTDCASIVFRSPSRTREGQPWTPALVQEVRRRMDEIPYLASYSFAGDP